MDCCFVMVIRVFVVAWVFLWCSGLHAGFLSPEEPSYTQDRHDVRNVGYVRTFLTYEEQLALLNFMTRHFYCFAEPSVLKEEFDMRIESIFDDRQLVRMRDDSQCYIFIDNVEHNGKTCESLCVTYIQRPFGFYFCLPQSLRKVSDKVVRIFDEFCTQQSDFAQGILLIIASYGHLCVKKVPVEDKKMPIYDMQNIIEIFS